MLSKNPMLCSNALTESESSPDTPGMAIAI